MTATHYVLPRGKHTLCKTAEFFQAQGGLVQDWGRRWVAVTADSILEARRVGATLEPINSQWRRLTEDEAETEVVA